MTDITHTHTPDGTYLFEQTLDDGRRIVAVVLPEDIDEIAGPMSAEPDGPERRRRLRVAQLLGEADLGEQRRG